MLDHPAPLGGVVVRLRRHHRQQAGHQVVGKQQCRQDPGPSSPQQRRGKQPEWEQAQNPQFGTARLRADHRRRVEHEPGDAGEEKGFGIQAGGLGLLFDDGSGSPLRFSPNNQQPTTSNQQPTTNNQQPQQGGTPRPGNPARHVGGHVELLAQHPRRENPRQQIAKTLEAKQEIARDHALPKGDSRPQQIHPPQSGFVRMVLRAQLAPIQYLETERVAQQDQQSRRHPVQHPLLPIPGKQVIEGYGQKQRNQVEQMNQHAQRRNNNGPPPSPTKHQAPGSQNQNTGQHVGLGFIRVAPETIGKGQKKSPRCEALGSGL